MAPFVGQKDIHTVGHRRQGTLEFNLCSDAARGLPWVSDGGLLAELAGHGQLRGALWRQVLARAVVHQPHEGVVVQPGQAAVRAALAQGLAPLVVGVGPVRSLTRLPVVLMRCRITISAERERK